MYGFYIQPQHSVNTVNRAFIPYTSSEIEALVAGYVEVADERAYNGRCFVKNGKKWIHNLGALRHKLNEVYRRYIDDEELAAPYPAGFSYDVANYYSRHQAQSVMNREDVKNLLRQIKVH